MLPKDRYGCPYLLLAPMEGVGDSCFRKAIASVGGFDEAVTEFLRVPSNAHVQGLAIRYHPHEIAPIPLAAQIMGGNPDLMGAMAYEIEKRGAHRIDINCGCPSNTVTGRGAGSSLLKDPKQLYAVASAVVKAVSVPVTIKMRSGYGDTSLFQENLLAAQQSGACYLTLHPRTKMEGYTGKANWELIARAKEILSIPVVGNGDIRTVDDAINMLKMTRCDGLMIGRGSVTNPFLFHQIRAHFSGIPCVVRGEDFVRFCQGFAAQLSSDVPTRSKINKMKQLMSFIFQYNEQFLGHRDKVLTAQHRTLEEYLHFATSLLTQVATYSSRPECW